MPDVPAELEMLRSELETARVVTDCAYNKMHALQEQHSELSTALADAEREVSAADDEELRQRDLYRAALRAHGFAETANGPRPAAPAPGRHELGAKTTFDARGLPIWSARPETGSGDAAGVAMGTGGQMEIQCCGVWIDYPTPGHDEQCSVCRSTFTVGTPA